MPMAQAVGGAAPSSLGGQVGVQDTYELMMALRKVNPNQVLRAGSNALQRFENPEP